jgi:2-dehydro-3-deoxygluconokinase
MTALVTIGEALGVLAATITGPLADGTPMRLGFAGAEATVAIGVRRLGHTSAWVGRVGDDAIGTMVLDRLRAELVDVTACQIADGVPSGLMLRELRTADRVRATYYRGGFAGSRLSPEDIDPGLIAGARLLHLTGITPALSESARATVRQAVDLAEAAGVTISLDLNYRAALWQPADAAAELSYLVSRSDIVFAGDDEAAMIVPRDEPERMAEALTALGPAEAVIKLGACGALAVVDGQVHRVPALPVTSVDPIGAGDAFVAGYLAGHLDGVPVDHRLRLAAACGAFTVSTHGDWQGFPRRADLDLLTASDVSR